MKWRALVVFVILQYVLTVELNAQIDSAITKIKMDFAVPDAPAFKILNIQPDNILRPATTQQLAVSIANPFLSSTLPSAFAMEFSPYLITAGKTVTLRDYQTSAARRFWHRLRVSIASQRSEATGDTTRVAVGLRFTLSDESDLRLNEKYISKLTNYNDSLLARESSIRDHFRGPAPLFMQMPKQKRDSIDALARDSIAVATKTLEAAIQAERDRAKREDWNKNITEFGIALSAASAESVGTHGIVNQKLSVWFVSAGTLSTWGQWVIGVNVAVGRNTTGRFDASGGSLGSRMYVGENAYKGFLQLEATTRDTSPMQYIAQLGGEIQLYDFVWADAAVGARKIGGGKPTLTSSFNIRFGTP